MAARAEEAGYSAICMTLDAKIKPKRERNIRNDYVGARNLPTTPQLDLGTHTWKFAADAPAGPQRHPGTWHPPGMTWNGSPRTSACPSSSRGLWPARTGDFRRKTAPGRSSSSNHGGRYLDTTPATIEVLPEVVNAVDGNAEVYLDGGIPSRNRHI